MRLSRIARLALRAPALRHVLAGEVHHRVATGERLSRRRFAQRVPAHRRHPEPRGGSLRVAREHRDLLAVARAAPRRAALPIRPVAPVSVTRIRLTSAGGRRHDRVGARLRVALGEAHLLPGERHAAGARLLGHRRRHRGRDIAVEDRGDDVVLAQLLLGDDLGDRAGGGHLHRLGDRRRTHVQRAAEDPREAQHVVDLVGVVRAARRHDPHVRGGLLGDDLGVWIGHREHHRVGVHLRQRLRRQRACAGDPDQQVGAVDHFSRGAGAALGVRHLRKPALHRVHLAVQVVLALRTCSAPRSRRR